MFTAAEGEAPRARAMARKSHCDEIGGTIGSFAPVHVRAVFDATDEQYVVVFEDSERHAVVAASRDTPSGQLEAQWFRQSVRIRRQRCGDELDDGGGDSVRQRVECPNGCRCVGMS